jgi:hypothetical protein
VGRREVFGLLSYSGYLYTVHQTPSHCLASALGFSIISHKSTYQSEKQNQRRIVTKEAQMFTGQRVDMFPSVLHSYQEIARSRSYYNTNTFLFFLTRSFFFFGLQPSAALFELLFPISRSQFWEAKFDQFLFALLSQYLPPSVHVVSKIV